MRRTDVAVVGAGIAGLSTAHALAGRGASVTVYERSRPGEAQSGGESRIFRHAHVDRRLVAFACEARRGWRDWEEQFGCELLSRDGVVMLGPEAERRLRVIEEAGGVRARAIDAAELAERLPLLGPYDGFAMLDEDGGVLRVRAAVEALAGVLHDALVFDEVLSVRAMPSGTVDVHHKAPTFSRWLDHFDHAVAVMGIEHVGLGADFIDQATPTQRDLAIAPDPATVARRKARLALEGFAAPEDYPALVNALRDRGYDGEQLEAILSANWLRLLRAAFAT